MPGADAKAVAKFRRNRKIRLVAHFGGKCLDCGNVFPPFVFDFDHRDPSVKEFALTKGGGCKSWDRMLAEAEKCDLVCANCHRMRTHKQRCTDTECLYC